jgi:hypothetical protein
MIAFVAIMLAFFGIYSAQTDISAASAQRNTQYTAYLDSAVQDCVREMKNGGDDETMMPEPADRERVMETFFRSLSMNFGYTTREDMERLHMYVPVLLLVDMDGYYIVSNELIEGDDGSLITPVISGLNPWTLVSEDGNYMIRYRLDTNVEVTVLKREDRNGNPTQVSGDFRDVYEELGSPYELKKLGFDGRDETINPVPDFMEKRNEWLIPELEHQVETYMNRNNIAAAYQDVAASYQFTMPQTEYDEWAGLLDGPSCMAFLQGVRVSNSRDYLNIYAFGGGEVRKAGASVFTGTDVRDGYENVYYAYGENRGEAAGYLPNGRAVALAGTQLEELTAEEKKALLLTQIHHHWGDPREGTGCYTDPVYHQHTSACYEITGHQHVNNAGEPIDGSMYLFLNVVNTSPASNERHQYVEEGNKRYILPITRREATNIVLPEYGGPGSCFTTPSYHRHTDACYQDVFHMHTGSADTGDGCYTVPIYHVHTSACYGTAGDQICGKTERTVESYALGCGYIDIFDSDSPEMKAYQAGKLSESYVLSKSLVGRELRCGLTEDTLVGYTISCGQVDGSYEDHEVVCGKDEDTIEWWNLGCGLSEGQKINEEQARRYNEP